MLIILNLIQLNYRHNFRISDSRIHQSNLLLYNHYTSLCQNYLNFNILHTFINLYIYIRQFIDLNMYMKINLSQFINNNSLNTNINLHTDFSKNRKFTMYMKVNTSLININLFQTTTRVSFLKFNMITNVFLSA